MGHRLHATRWHQPGGGYFLQSGDVPGGWRRELFPAYCLQAKAVNLLSFPVSCFLFPPSQGGGKHAPGHATDVTGVDNTPENREKKGIKRYYTPTGW